MNGTVVIFLVGVLIVALLLVAIIALTRRGPGPINVDEYRSRWLRIEQSLARDNVASYTVVVMDADKLLDQALKARGLSGETMGERMKNAKGKWSNANAVWASHKLRNQIAHENITLGYDQTRRALAGFKLGLKDLGVI